MKFKGLPEREVDEEPSTERQRRYLKDLVPWLKESDLRKLGIKQASFMIDQALKSRDEEDDEEENEDEDEDESFNRPSNRKKKESGCSVLTLLAFVILGWLGFRAYSKFSIHEKSQVEVNIPPSSPIQKIELSNQDRRVLSFENMPFPIEVVVSDPVNLLNTSAEEVTLKSGAVLVIESRNESGHISARVNGVLLFGDESRILEKIVIPSGEER